ncbi:hypothetical protein SIAM614_02706 [Stappia aggregata IAM 12614]|uniref:Uncharacterized protein n=1 Tax=Roseibium aggregatum (strain ATCC 25650 / DSM 13394 / JCM 20685 / NBRC 16684 / NCIMB 2208 / IAM 12614 / B1) TaxID=384765 RepID=A0NUF0_ROSAI|nr:hypothetical protein SIAM614_02706 [Stappia aggregata IAM 12614] [Roseibium aggregatum IAM 12614]
MSGRDEIRPATIRSSSQFWMSSRPWARSFFSGSCLVSCDLAGSCGSAQPCSLLSMSRKASIAFW